MPNLFERSSEAKPLAPRRFDGEVGRMIQDENLAFGLEQIVHPGKPTKELPEVLQVGRVVKPSSEGGKEEETLLT